MADNDIVRRGYLNIIQKRKGKMVRYYINTLLYMGLGLRLGQELGQGVGLGQALKLGLSLPHVISVLSLSTTAFKKIGYDLSACAI